MYFVSSPGGGRKERQEKEELGLGLAGKWDLPVRDISQSVTQRDVPSTEKRWIFLTGFLLEWRTGKRQNESQDFEKGNLEGNFSPAHISGDSRGYSNTWPVFRSIIIYPLNGRKALPCLALPSYRRVFIHPKLSSRNRGGYYEIFTPPIVFEIPSEFHYRKQ